MCMDSAIRLGGPSVSKKRRSLREDSRCNCAVHDTEDVASLCFLFVMRRVGERLGEL